MLPYTFFPLTPKKNKYALLIPTLNEGKYIQGQLARMKTHDIFDIVDVFILDSCSTDGSVENQALKILGATGKLTITAGHQGTAFRCGFHEALKQGYAGVITIDGNNKDSVEDIPKFIAALEEGIDFIQGSRFAKGGQHKNTPFIRLVANKMILIPWVRMLAKYPYTEVASAFRGMSRRFLEDKRLGIERDCFVGYELLWYISVMAPKLKYKVMEIPIKRLYPKGPTPTKITWGRCVGIIRQLIQLTLGHYRPKQK